MQIDCRHNTAEIDKQEDLHKATSVVTLKLVPDKSVAICVHC